MGFDEVDAWYEEQKTRLAEEYRKGLLKGRDKERLRTAFDMKLSAAAREYEARNSKIIRSQLKKGRRDHRISMMVRPLLSRISIFMERFSKKKQEERS
jgi:pantothenate kinase-related protein Tda10